jgi:PAS domain S-box-containing protein
MSPEPAPASNGSSHADGSLPFLLSPGDGLLLISQGLELLHIDRTARQWLGIGPDAPLDQPLAELWPELAERLLLPMPELTKGPCDRCLEFQGRPVECRHFLTDAGYGVGLLLTETIHGSAWEQMRLIRTLLEAVQDSVLVTTAEPHDSPGPVILYVNDAMVVQSGYGRQEILGRSPRLFQGPETNHSELKRFRAALDSWQRVEVELLNYRRDGTTYWTEIKASPLLDAQGWYSHWVSVQRSA